MDRRRGSPGYARTRQGQRPVCGPPASLFPATLPDEFGRQVGVPVWLENDANLGALGEGEFGAAENMANFIYIKIAYGIGAGLVLNRRLYRGTNGLAGELAHIHTEVDGALCFCGGRGCITTTFSPRRLVEWIQTVHPGVETIDDVLALAADKDAGVWRALRDLGRAIGRSLADFCIYMAPDGIVLDGILGKGAEPVIEGVKEMLDRFAPPMIVSQLEICGGQLGNDAELRGAAVLARQCQLGFDHPFICREGYSAKSVLVVSSRHSSASARCASSTAVAVARASRPSSSRAAVG